MAPATSTPERAADPVASASGLTRSSALGFLSPALVLVGVFLVFPALWTLYLGLTSYGLTGVEAVRPEFTGAENYGRAVTDPEFGSALWLSLLFVLGSAVIGQSGLGFLLAWSLRTARRGVRTLVETLVLLAWILPSSIVAFLWLALLDREGGTVNALLGTPGLAWLLDYPMASIIVFNTWRGAAFSMLLFSAAIQAVPPSQLESARLAGAGSWQQLRDVVFPHIRGHLLTNLLLITLWTFNDFTPYLITAGGPDGATEVLPVFIYQTAVGFGKLGYGAAIASVMLAVNLVIAVGYLRLLRRKGAGA